MVASAFLPVAIHRGELYFLFGKEVDHDSMPGFSDFGGRVEPNESILDAGIREFAEEISGFLGNEQQLHQRIQKTGCLAYFYEKHKYHIHILPIAYDESLVKYFNASHQFIHAKVPTEELKKYSLFEKTELQWFSVKDMEGSLGEFREFYREIVQFLLTHRDEIRAFLKPKRKTRKHLKIE
jgi:8-oxo-dGTP pyrophosphatase MutT (NUDIX family)